MPKQVLQPMPAPDTASAPGTAPAPAGAPIPRGALETTGGLNMTRPSEEMRKDILGQVDKLKNLEGSFNAKQFMNNNKMNEMREENTSSFFQLLSEMGVDPSNLSSISDFLQKLEESNPDLYVIFERAFSQLMGEASGGGPQQEVIPKEEGSGLDERFSGLQQSIQRQQ